MVGTLKDIPANDKRRKSLKKNFKDTYGLDAVIQLSREHLSTNPKAYMSKYTHFLEELLIKNTSEKDDFIFDANKIFNKKTCNKL